MIKISKVDLYWNYGATFLKIGSSILLMPLILNKMSPSSVGIWNIFLTISFFLSLVDFGFNASFTRHITYIFSGIKEISMTGFIWDKSNQKTEQDFELLKSIIQTMRSFYLKLSIITFVLMCTIGSLYINSIIKSYPGDHTIILVSWFLFVIVNCYNLYTLYYETLLLGRGLMKKSKQLIIIGQIAYLLVAGILILIGYDLLAIVIGQFVSVIIVRSLSYRIFFTRELVDKLRDTILTKSNHILKKIMPNAIKMGITSFGGFLVQRSSILIGSLYLNLEQVASYGISLQVINLIASLAVIYQSTYLPKINQLRLIGDLGGLKQLHIKSKLVFIITFLFGCIFIYYFAPIALKYLSSSTQLVSGNILILMFLVAFIENNIILASNIILSKNEVPFYKASLLSGFFIVIGLIFIFKYTDFGILNLVLVPLIIDILYQGWKWPLDVIRDLNITFYDYLKTIKLIFNKI